MRGRARVLGRGLRYFGPMKWVVLLAACMVSTVALATQIVVREVDLDDALQRATIVVEAEALSEQADVRGRPWGMRVTDVLLQPADGSLQAGEELHVFGRRTLVSHATARVNHNARVRRSPLLYQLRNAPEMVAGQRYCVMLTHTFERGLSPDRIYATSVERAHVPAPCRQLRRRLSQR